MQTELLVELYDVARLMRTRFDRWARTYGMTRAQGVILARLARQHRVAAAQVRAAIPQATIQEHFGIVLNGFTVRLPA